MNASKKTMTSEEIIADKKARGQPVVDLMRQIRKRQELVGELKQCLQKDKEDFAHMEQVVQALTAQVAERDAQLREIQSSKAWRFAMLLRRIRVRPAPPGSWREKLARWVYSAVKIWRREGLITLMRKINGLIILKTGVSLSDYQEWILNNEPRPKQLAEQRLKVNDFEYRPLISVVMPVWNTPVKILEQTIRSVVDQTYDKWELCIADGNSNPETKKVLSDWANKDGRIKIKFLNENKGIAVNSNEALSLAQGDFVAFLDHDDLLAPFALFEVANRLQGDTNVDLIYSDEDKTNESGGRIDPFFKPGFSPDLLRSVNYMSHFLVIRKSLGDQIGWIRNGFEGAQDYDFILRATEKTKKIVRIPKILYHWCLVQGSAASSTDAKPDAGVSGIRALQEHLQRMGLSGKVENNLFSTWYNVQYELPEQPLISIIIPSHNHADNLSRCVNSILEKSTYSNFEILIVENNSGQEEIFLLYEHFRKQDERIAIKEWKKPFNYSLINNWAAQAAKGKVLLFLNNDTEIIIPDWQEQMLMHAFRPEIGTVGAKLYYPSNMIQHAGVVIGIGGVAGHGHKGYTRSSWGYFGQLMQVRNVAANTAACVMIRRQVFEEVNGFDEKFILAFGDVDLCLKIHEKGYLNLWTPYAEVYHHESKTRGYEETPEQQARFTREVEYFKQKWASFLHKGDPFYNPNLSLEYEDFRLNLAVQK